MRYMVHIYDMEDDDNIERSYGPYSSLRLAEKMEKALDSKIKIIVGITALLCRRWKVSDSISTFFAKFMFAFMTIGACLDLAGCSGMQIQYPDDKTLCDSPTLEQRLATLQRSSEMSSYNSGYSLGILGAEWFEGELKFIQ